MEKSRKRLAGREIMFSVTLLLASLLSSPSQTDATLLANNSQQCWMLHVASVCTPCCMLLRVVGSCCVKFEIGQTFSFVQTDAASRCCLSSLLSAPFLPFQVPWLFSCFFFLQEKGQSSVFSRLGELASPATQTTVQAVNPRVRLPSDDGPHAGVDYTSHSVLQPVKRKGNQAKPVKPVKPVKRTLGLTSDVDEKSVFARLGSKVQQWRCSNFKSVLRNWRFFLISCSYDQSESFTSWTSNSSGDYL